MKRKVKVIITLHMLRAMDACGPALEAFEGAFGDRVDISSINWHDPNFDWLSSHYHWMVNGLIQGEAAYCDYCDNSIEPMMRRYDQWYNSSPASSDNDLRLYYQGRRARWAALTEYVLELANDPGRRHELNPLLFARKKDLPFVAVTLRRVLLNAGGYTKYGVYFGRGQKVWSYEHGGYTQYTRAASKAAAKECVRHVPGLCYKNIRWV